MRCSPMILISLIAVSLATGAAQAQGQTPAQNSGAPSNQSLSAQASQAAADVSKWSRRQWHAATTKWAEEKDAWNGCRTQAKEKNLSGRHSWQFLYDCMTKS